MLDIKVNFKLEVSGLSSGLLLQSSLLDNPSRLANLIWAKKKKIPILNLSDGVVELLEPEVTDQCRNVFRWNTMGIIQIGDVAESVYKHIQRKQWTN